MPGFPPFRPDQGELLSSTLSNVIMREKGFGPTKKLAAVGGAVALPAAPRGALTTVIGTTFAAFVATDTQIYKMDSGFDFDSLAATVDAPDGYDHSMCQFGVYLIVSDTASGLMAYNISTPAGVNAVSGAPAARVVFATNNMLVGLGNGSNLLQLKTTAFGDHTNWLTEGATTITFIDGEELMAGGDLGGPLSLVLQKNMVRRMVFDPSLPVPFRIEKVIEGVGAVHYRSTVFYRKMCFFLHQNGFQMCDGETVTNIGSEKVNRWFTEERCPDLTKVYGAIDPKNTRIRFRYKSSNCTSETVYDDILDFNWRLGEFVPCSEQTAAIFQLATPGKTLEDLDAYGTMETLAYSLDSSFWAGSSPNLGGLDSALKFGFFDGATAAATLETATAQSPNSVVINRATPITDNPDVTLQVGVKDAMSGTLDWCDEASIMDDAGVPLDGRGKCYRFRMNHAAGATWSQAHGVEAIELAQGGPR